MITKLACVHWFDNYRFCKDIFNMSGAAGLVKKKKYGEWFT